MFSFATSRNHAGVTSPNRARVSKSRGALENSRDSTPWRASKSTQSRAISTRRIAINQRKRRRDHVPSGCACAFDQLSIGRLATVRVLFNKASCKRACAEVPCAYNLSPSLRQILSTIQALAQPTARQRPTLAVAFLPWGLTAIWHEFPVTWRFREPASGLIYRQSSRTTCCDRRSRQLCAIAFYSFAFSYTNCNQVSK